MKQFGVDHFEDQPIYSTNLSERIPEMHILIHLRLMLLYSKYPGIKKQYCSKRDFMTARGTDASELVVIMSNNDLDFCTYISSCSELNTFSLCRNVIKKI